MAQIIPALITSDEDSTNDFKELKLKFEKLQPFLADFGNWVQIDIIMENLCRPKPLLI